MGSRSDDLDAYASTTASPPPIQISLDDSIDIEYKETHYGNGGGLISPGTDFSEQGGFFKDVSDEDSQTGSAPQYEQGFARYRTQLSSASTPVANHGNVYSQASTASRGAPPPGMGSTPMMGGCTWHTVNNSPSSNLRGDSNPIAISQHLPPSSPNSNSQPANPLSSLTQQIQMAMMMENSGIGVDSSSAMQMTEILMNTVSGINTLRSAIGESVLGEFLALLLKDGPKPESQRDSGQTYLPVGLLDN